MYKRQGLVRDLNYASGSIESVRGTVSSSWMRHGDGLRLEVTVPVGSTAEVVVPKMNLRDVEVREGGKPVWAEGKYVAGAPGVTSANESGDDIRIVVGSGTYVFERQGN